MPSQETRLLVCLQERSIADKRNMNKDGFVNVPGGSTFSSNPI